MVVAHSTSLDRARVVWEKVKDQKNRENSQPGLSNQSLTKRSTKRVEGSLREFVDHHSQTVQGVEQFGPQKNLDGVERKVVDVTSFVFLWKKKRVGTSEKSQNVPSAILIHTKKYYFFQMITLFTFIFFWVIWT